MNRFRCNRIPRVKQLTEYKILDTAYANFGKLKMDSQFQPYINKKILLNDEGIVYPNMTNPVVYGMLAEVDLARRRNFIQTNIQYGFLLADIEEYVMDNIDVSFITVCKPFYFAAVNSLFLCLCLKDMGDLKRVSDLINELRTIGKKHNVWVIVYPASSDSYIKMLQRREKNLTQYSFKNGFVLTGQSVFWSHIRKAWCDGKHITSSNKLPKIMKMSENDLVYNMTRYGYGEFGSAIRTGNSMDVESTITALLYSDEPRRYSIGAPVLIAKNEIDVGYLLFLADSFKLLKKLGGAATVLKKANIKNTNVNDILALLYDIDVKKMDDFGDNALIYNIT